MAVINISLLDLLTMTYSSVTCFCDDYPDNFDDIMTTLSTTATFAGSTLDFFKSNDINITISKDYIESMSDKQLEELVVKLDDKNKEMELDISDKDKPVVKLLSNSPKK